MATATRSRGSKPKATETEAKQQAEPDTSAEAAEEASKGTQAAEATTPQAEQDGAQEANGQPSGRSSLTKAQSKELGERLKNARLKNGNPSRKRLAEMLDKPGGGHWTQGYVFGVESGRMNPAVEFVQEYARYFGVSFESLLDGIPIHSLHSANRPRRGASARPTTTRRTGRVWSRDGSSKGLSFKGEITIDPQELADGMSLILRDGQVTVTGKGFGFSGDMGAAV